MHVFPGFMFGTRNSSLSGIGLEHFHYSIVQALHCMAFVFVLELCVLL